MARPRSLPDDVVLERLLQTLSQAGPDNLTFQRAADGVGLSAATLVQRFGSREKMVEATLLFAWDRLERETGAADALHPDTPEGAIALLLQLTPEDLTGAGFADGLLLLREDFRNPVLRARGGAWGEGLAQALGRRLTGSRTEAGRLGWQMASLWQGALIWQGFRQDAAAKETVRQMLEAWCAVTAEETS